MQNHIIRSLTAQELPALHTSYFVLPMRCQPRSLRIAVTCLLRIAHDDLELQKERLVKCEFDVEV